MTEIVHLAVYDTFADWETGFATAHLNKPNWQKTPGRFAVRTVGASTEPITTAGGMRIVPDGTLAELTPADSAMLILAGNDIWNTDAYLPFTAKAREFLDAGVPVAAICGATGGMALAGLLDDREHTSNAAAFLESTGYKGAERYREEPAVTDGDLITGSGTAPVDFAVHIFTRLGVYEPGVLASWLKLYGDNDPAGFYELMSA